VLITVGEVVVQEMAARMGAVTGKGTADLIRERFGVKVTTFAMFCLLLANMGTTVAQFAGIAAAGELFGISRYFTVPLAALLMTMLVLRGSYKHVEKVLIVLCLSALSYVVTVVLIGYYRNHDHALGNFLYAGIRSRQRGGY
jgi:Mn2+/Fe2+ NRAMP family transporter